MKKRFFFTSILLILSAFSLAGKEIIFAQKGKSIPVIVLPGKRITPQQKTAKEELEEFFEKVLSVKLKTATHTGEEKSFNIILSDLSQKENLIPADIKAKLEKCPSGDAFYFRLKDKSFIIAGKTP
ncbi:MAG: hypothetical protein IKC08_04695, partial [Lentisphaeria bacterium]|nr:hypothetical protein [Lentisphaeria bacterium]